MLITFIVIIETISNLIQPVRLTADMIAGHLLLTLLGNNGPSINHTLLTVLVKFPAQTNLHTKIKKYNSPQTRTRNNKLHIQQRN